MSLWQKFRCWIGSHGDIHGTAKPLVNDEGMEVIAIFLYCPHCKQPMARIDVGRLPPTSMTTDDREGARLH